jgi:hypothetical protein
MFGLLQSLRVFVLLLLCASAAQAEVTNWGNAPNNVNLLTTADNRASTPAGVTLNSTATNAGGTANDVTVINGTPPGSINAGVVRFAMTAPNNTTGSANQTMTMTFPEPVFGVSFTILDIDGGPTYSDGNRFNDYVFVNSNAGFATSVTFDNTFLEYDGTIGRGRTIQTLNTGTTTAQGSMTFNFAGPVTSITVSYRNGPSAANPTNQWVFLDDVAFKRAPQLRVNKSASVGSATFDFSTSNSGGVAGTTATNVTAGTNVNSPFVVLNAPSVATTLTETNPPGWIITGATVNCADSNNALSGNPATFTATVSAFKTITVAAANIRAGAIITCTFTNQKRPTLQIRKISQGATGTFNFTGSNGWVAEDIVTAVSGTAVTGTVQTLTGAGTATTVAETAITGWDVNGTPTCTVNGVASAITYTVATREISLTAAQTAASNAIVCTYTNRRLPRVTVRKTTLGGSGGAFTFTQSGLAAIANITTTAVNTATPTPTGLIYGSVGGATSVTEGAMPNATWIFDSVACTDANSAISGNPVNVGAVAGQAVTLTAAMVAGADIVCTFTNGIRPTLRVSKITLGNAAASPNFTFTQSNLASVPGPLATTGNNVANTTAAINITNKTLNAVVTEGVTAGYVLAGATCTDSNAAVSGNPASFGNLVGTQITVVPANLAYGAAITCTFTNNRIATMEVRKTTVGGFGGPFTFTQSNLSANPSNISTAAANTATAGAPATVNVVGFSTDVTVIEGAFSGYIIASANCTDSNAAITGNAGTFGGLSGSTLTVLGSFVKPGAQFVCTFTNNRLPTITLRKTSLGNVGTFQFTGDNGFTATSIVTTTSGTQVTGPVRTLAAVSTDTNVTETAVAGYVMSLTSCTGLTNAATATLSGTTIQIPQAGTAPGAAIVCNVTNTKTPTLLVRKTTLGGVNGPFTFTTSNVTGTITGITTSVAGTPVATAAGALPVTAIGTAVEVTEAAFAGYFISGASCTDSNAAITLNAGSFGTLASNKITIPVARVVAGAEFVCTFSNTLANPQLTLTKTAAPAGPKSVNNVVTYTFAVQNTGNVTLTNVVVTETAFNGYGTAPVPGSEVLFNDVAPLGDSTDGGVNGIWSTLGPGDTVRYTAPYTVVQSDIDLNQ